MVVMHPVIGSQQNTCSKQCKNDLPGYGRQISCVLILKFIIGLFHVRHFAHLCWLNSFELLCFSSKRNFVILFYGRGFYMKGGMFSFLRNEKRIVVARGNKTTRTG